MPPSNLKFRTLAGQIFSVHLVRDDREFMKSWQWVIQELLIAKPRGISRFGSRAEQKRVDPSLLLSGFSHHNEERRKGHTYLAGHGAAEYRPHQDHCQVVQGSRGPRFAVQARPWPGPPWPGVVGQANNHYGELETRQGFDKFDCVPDCLTRYLKYLNNI